MFSQKMEKKMKPLSLMSRGQRILMLSLNKNLKSAANAMPTEAAAALPPPPPEPPPAAPATDVDELCAHTSVVPTKIRKQKAANEPEVEANLSVRPTTENLCQNYSAHISKRIKIRPTEDRHARRKIKHPMLNSCSCKQRCLDKVSEDRRKQIHEEFWSMTYNARRA